MKEYVKNYLANDFIRPSQSPAAALVMFVKRPDGKLRLVVDYRGLNSVTVKNRFPLPLIPEMLDRLHTAKVFTKIDLRNAYHQVRVKEGDEWKTAFRCREGHFEYQVCPQGPTNAPAAFQYFMNDILREHLDIICVGILDDVIVYSENPAQHVGHVRTILQILRDHQLYAKIEKCEFHRPEMTILQHFQPDLPLTIEADASDFALGCIISQTSAAGDLHPICFYSRKFTPDELNYPIYDKELLAVVEAFRQWRVYAEGAVVPIQVYTDHKNLEYFSHARTTSRRHARWAATMAAYNYIITYRKGASNGKADALSRNPAFLPPPLPSLPILLPTGPAPLLHTPHLLGAAVMLLHDDPLLPDIAAAQAADPALSATMATLRAGPGGESNPALPDGRPSGGSHDQFRVQFGLLYHQDRILIPPSATSLILRILQHYHDSPLARHYGVARTQALVAQYFKWTGLATAVEGYVRSCDACQRNKVVRHAPFGLLNPLPIPSRPWSSVSLD